MVGRFVNQHSHGKRLREVDRHWNLWEVLADAVLHDAPEAERDVRLVRNPRSALTVLSNKSRDVAQPIKQLNSSFQGHSKRWIYLQFKLITQQTSLDSHLLRHQNIWHQELRACLTLPPWKNLRLHFRGNKTKKLSKLIWNQGLLVPLSNPLNCFSHHHWGTKWFLFPSGIIFKDKKLGPYFWLEDGDARLLLDVGGLPVLGLLSLGRRGVGVRLQKEILASKIKRDRRCSNSHPTRIVGITVGGLNGAIAWPKLMSRY